MTFNSKYGPQDLPPKNGYSVLDFSRIKLRRVVQGRWAFGLFIAANVFGLPLYYENLKTNKRIMIAKLSDELAVYPLFLAEMDRNILRYMKKARDIEADIMKNFPKWEVGTYFGSRRYQSLPEDTYVTPDICDFLMFTKDIVPNSIVYTQ